MNVNFATLGYLYSKYANTQLPWTKLHAYSAKLATAPVGQANAVELPDAPAQHSRAKLYAYRTAVVPHHIMRLPDAMFGTGVNRQASPVSIANGKEAVAHLSEVIRSPFDTGLMGLAMGVFLLRTMAVGAAGGALLGAAVCASPESIDTCVAAGSLLSAAWFGLLPALIFCGMNGLARGGTSLAKFALVGAFFGAGYAVGAMVDEFSASQDPVGI